MHFIQPNVHWKVRVYFCSHQERVEACMHLMTTTCIKQRNAELFPVRGASRKPTGLHMKLATTNVDHCEALRSKVRTKDLVARGMMVLLLRKASFARGRNLCVAMAVHGLEQGNSP